MIEAKIKAINDAIPDTMIYEKTDALTDAKIFGLIISTLEKRYLVPSLIAGTSLQRYLYAIFLSAKANNNGGIRNE